MLTKNFTLINESLKLIPEFWGQNTLSSEIARLKVLHKTPINWTNTHHLTIKMFLSLYLDENIERLLDLRSFHAEFFFLQNLIEWKFSWLKW